MSTWSAEMRKLEDERRREDREAKKRQRDLERRLKEEAKLSELERARFQVDAYENSIEVLLSVHKDQHTKLDWKALASALRPHEPPKLSRHELAVVPAALGASESNDAAIEQARALDESEHQAALAEFQNELAQWTKLNSLAKRVLAGEARAYKEAISEFPILAEISNLGSSIHVTIHNKYLVECELKVKRGDVIPSEIKSLSASGKLVVKPMPKARSHELYQDYVSGCILRLARELFALLPVESVLLTATVDGIDKRTGHKAKVPVISMAASRAVLENLNFDQLNPSDALDNFQHRGELMTSRRPSEFVPIIPLTPDDIESAGQKESDLSSLVARVNELRREFAGSLQASVT